MLSLSVLEPTQLVTLPSYRAWYPRLHDFAARACFTLTRNIRLNVFQERGTGMPPLRRARSMSRSAHEETRTPKTTMDKSLIGPAGRRDLCMHPQSSPVSPLKNFGASARPLFGRLFSLSLVFLSYLFLSSGVESSKWEYVQIHLGRWPQQGTA